MLARTAVTARTPAAKQLAQRHIRSGRILEISTPNWVSLSFDINGHATVRASCPLEQVLPIHRFDQGSLPSEYAMKVHQFSARESSSYLLLRYSNAETQH
jgi:hypothetical protein